MTPKPDTDIDGSPWFQMPARHELLASIENDYVVFHQEHFNEEPVCLSIEMAQVPIVISWLQYLCAWYTDHASTGKPCPTEKRYEL